MPGITVSAHTNGQDKPGPNDKHSILHCDVLLWVGADGFVRLAQVTKSTGYARMDDACLHATIGQPLKAAQGESGPVAAWAILPITWDFLGDTSKVKEPDRPNFAIAPIAPNQVPRVSDADYPKGALQRGEHGIVYVHVAVSDSGAITDLKIAQSSGSADLDRAALDALRTFRVSPAYSDHKPVSSETVVAIAWVIPGADTMPPAALQK